MSQRPRRGRAAAVGVIAVSLLCGPAGAEEESERWVPSLALTGNILVQNWDGALSSSRCQGCVIPDPVNEQPLRIGTDGSDQDLTPAVGATFELMTPALPFPGSPRLFGSAEIAPSFGTLRKVANEGDPSRIRSPSPQVPPPPFSADAALGQGSELVAEFGDLVYGAQAGVSFDVEVGERRLRIRPSFGWIHYEVELDALVLDAECTPSGATTACVPPGFLREVRLTASDEESFHGIGPGLDVELLTGRLGPFGTSIFLGGRAYRILGDRSVELASPVVSFDDALGMDTAAADFEFEIDDWLYRFGVGFRLRWLGGP